MVNQNCFADQENVTMQIYYAYDIVFNIYTLLYNKMSINYRGTAYQRRDDVL